MTFEPGEEPIRKVVPNGKTDRQIVREMLVPRGVSDAAVDAGFAELERIAWSNWRRVLDAWWR